MMQNAKAVQWDLKVYYYAAQCFRQGLNPYDVNSLTQISEGAVKLPFVYPPVTLAIFLPFTLLSLKSAMKLWMLLKLGIVLASCASWMRWLSLKTSLPLALMALAGFNLAIVHDLASGNISALEQLLLIVALTSLLRGNNAVFIVALALCAQIKLLPIAFAVVPLLFHGKDGLRTTVLAAGLWAVLFSLNLILFPDMSHALFDSLAALDERGEINPSSLALIRDLAALAGVTESWPPVVFYLAFASFAAFLCLRTAIAPKTSQRTRAMLLLVTAYALAVPRFKDYSYVLLLAPLAACLFARGRPALRAGVALLALVPNLANLLYLKGASRLLFDYQPLLAAGLLFAFFLKDSPEPQDPAVEPNS